jgi:hypothetical protein
MTPGETVHLSQEAVNDVLIGMASPEAEAHLAACAHCRKQVSQFQTDMDIFNETSLAWSEARPSKPIRVAPRSALREVVRSPLTWALAAALLLMAGVPEWRPRLDSILHPASVSENSTSANGSLDSEAQIAQDNDLLQSVNVALNSNEESPINEYGLSEEPAQRSRTRPAINQ